MVLLLLTSLACGLSFNNDNENETEALQLQLTRQSLQMTQAADSGSQNQGSTAPQGDSPAPAEKEEEEEDDGIPCNDSHIIGETIKDGTVFKPGEAFEKTWTLRNEGDCDWTTSYNLKFIEGSRMGGASSIKVPSVIEPNEDITFKVNLTAPDTDGDYTGVWQLFAADGEEMGRYWVKITVGEKAPPPDSFAVTGVLLIVPASPFESICPEILPVAAEITVNAAGTVTYKWGGSYGDGKTGTLTFDAPGKKTVNYNTDLVMSQNDYWVGLYIDEPNHQWFLREFEVICNP